MAFYKYGRCARCGKELYSTSKYKTCESCRLDMIAYRKKRSRKFGEKPPVSTVDFAKSKEDKSTHREVEKPALHPTKHGPGSEGKIEELARRYLEGEQLFQIGDSPECDVQEPSEKFRRKK